MILSTTLQKFHLVLAIIVFEVVAVNSAINSSWFFQFTKTVGSHVIIRATDLCKTYGKGSFLISPRKGPLQKFYLVLSIIAFAGPWHGIAQ